MKERNIAILAMQDTTCREEETVKSEGFMMLKKKLEKKQE